MRVNTRVYADTRTRESACERHARETTGFSGERAVSMPHVRTLPHMPTILPHNIEIMQTTDVFAKAIDGRLGHGLAPGVEGRSQLSRGHGAESAKQRCSSRIRAGPGSAGGSAGGPYHMGRVSAANRSLRCAQQLALVHGSAAAWPMRATQRGCRRRGGEEERRLHCGVIRNAVLNPLGK